MIHGKFMADTVSASPLLIGQGSFGSGPTNLHPEIKELPIK
jgi:hypothetical protein